MDWTHSSPSQQQQQSLESDDEDSGSFYAPRRSCGAKRPKRSAGARSGGALSGKGSTAAVTAIDGGDDSAQENSNAQPTRRQVRWLC